MFVMLYMIVFEEFQSDSNMKHYCMSIEQLINAKCVGHDIYEVQVKTTEYTLCDYLSTSHQFEPSPDLVL